MGALFEISFRIAKLIINSIGSCGSYLDGGAAHPFQEAAIPMLEPSLVKHEMIHLQRHFRVSLVAIKPRENSS